MNKKNIHGLINLRKYLSAQNCIFQMEYRQHSSQTTLYLFKISIQKSPDLSKRLFS